MGKKNAMRGKFLQIQEDCFRCQIRGVADKMRDRFERAFRGFARSSYRKSACFFESARELQHAAFAKVRSKNLHADRQAGLRLSAGNRDARNARQRTRNGIDISEIHLQRVGRFLAQAKRRSRRSRRDDRIHLSETRRRNRGRSASELSARGDSRRRSSRRRGRRCRA